MEGKDKVDEKLKVLFQQRVLKALSRVLWPGYSRNIISFGLVKEIDVQDEKNILVRIEVPTENESIIQKIADDSKRMLEKEFEKDDININLQVAKRPVFLKRRIPIKGFAVAVYSTKGGVGKSSFAVNLAWTFALLELKTSLLDLDVHGPSIPLMTGTQDYTPSSPDGKFMMPAEKNGVRIMSLGYLAKDSPVVWRGPLVSKAFDTLVFQTYWPDTEVLVMDMPPGSGDIQLNLAQRTQIDLMVMITTPQDVALADVRRGIQMFQKLDVKIAGVVENMAYFVCDECGKKHYIFGEGGGRKVAQEFNVDFLGEVPLDPRLRECADKGEIFVLKYPESQTAQVFKEIAKKILQKARQIQ